MYALFFAFIFSYNIAMIIKINQHLTKLQSNTHWHVLYGPWCNII